LVQITVVPRVVSITIAAANEPQRLLRLHNLYALASSGPERRAFFDEVQARLFFSG